MLIIENNLLRNLELIESIENGLKIEINLLKSRNNLINTQTGKTKWDGFVYFFPKESSTVISRFCALVSYIPIHKYHFSYILIFIIHWLYPHPFGSLLTKQWILEIKHNRFKYFFNWKWEMVPLMILSSKFVMTSFSRNHFKKLFFHIFSWCRFLSCVE